MTCVNQSPSSSLAEVVNQEVQPKLPPPKETESSEVVRAPRRRGWSKERQREYNTAYYLLNKEKLKQRAKEQRLKNPEYGKEYDKKYKLTHRAEYRGYQNKYHATHRKVCHERVKKWKEKNPHLVRRYGKIGRQRNPGRQALLEQKRRAQKVSSKVEPRMIIPWVGKRKKCFYCGKVKKATMDHLIPLSKNGEHSMRNIVPACHKCNSSKNKKDANDFIKVGQLVLI